MNGEYVKCGSNLKMSLCMNTECMCKNFVDVMIRTYPEEEARAGTKLVEINCAVYAFTKGGLIKYGYREIRSLTENEIKEFTLI